MKLTTKVLSESHSTLTRLVSDTFECLVQRIAIGDASGEVGMRNQNARTLFKRKRTNFERVIGKLGLESRSVDQFNELSEISRLDRAVRWGRKSPSDGAIPTVNGRPGPLTP